MVGPAIATELIYTAGMISAERCERIGLYKRHVELFAKTWKNNERKIHTLNKFCKIYIQNFEGASSLRESLMAATSTDELLEILQGEL